MIFHSVRLALCTLTLSATIAGAAPVSLTAERFDIQGDVGFEQLDGRQVMRLGAPAAGPRKGGGADIKGLDFSTGILEFDMRLPDAMEFSGPIFRQSASGSAEYVYMRPHLTGKPDAIQYTPIVHGSLAWQIFAGPGFEAEVRYPLNQWMHVRADIYETSATISIDGKPVLRMPELKNGKGSGALGFASLMGGTYYSNLNVEPIAGYRDPNPPSQPKALQQGTITSWQVTEAMTQEEGFSRAAKRDWNGLKWHSIAVENNGIANLSKAGPDGDKEHSFIARFEVQSKNARTAPMQFGFSDKTRVYFNGSPIYEGSDLQNSRDYRFLGHVGFWDTLFLPLKAGTNEVTFVVTDDTNGGTAAAAIIDPGTGEY